MTNLDGATVLITRPEAYSSYLSEEIKRLGGIPVIFPTLDVEYCTQGLDEESFNGHDLAVFTSRNAVAAVAEYLKREGMNWPKSLRCAAVGNKTADAVRGAFGVGEVIAPTKDFGGTALMTLESMQNLSGQRVIFFDGGGPRSVLLVGMLEDKDCMAVTHAVVYGRVQPPSDPSVLQSVLGESGVDFVVFTSVASSANLLEMLDTELVNKLKRAVVIVYSKRIQQELEKWGFEQIVVSEIPSDDAVLEAIIKTQRDSVKRTGKKRKVFADVGTI